MLKNRRALLAIILSSTYIVSLVLSFFVPSRNPEIAALVAVSFFVCALSIPMILFPYHFAKFELLFKVRDYDNAEPHDLSIFAAKIGGWLLYVMAIGCVIASAAL